MNILNISMCNSNPSSNTYMVLSYYYIADEPEDTNISIDGQTNSYQQAELIAKNVAESVLSLMKQTVSGMEIGILYDEERILVGNINKFDEMTYGGYAGYEGIGDYCIITIHKKAREQIS
jgi:hypothetical protein